MNSSTAAAITLSRINTSIGASDWGVNGEEALQDCDKRWSEKIADRVSLRSFFWHFFWWWITASTILSLAYVAASPKTKSGGGE
jgi:hypothetical protein